MLRKQGGAWKSWNVRYFVLSSNALYYFKQPKPADNDVPEGGITLNEMVDVAGAEDKTKRETLLLRDDTRAHVLLLRG